MTTHDTRSQDGSSDTANETGHQRGTESTKDRVIIFDTTLRDGEQSPGGSMNFEEKLEIALALDELGVDVIEAGFAAASPGDFNAVLAIAQRIQRATVCGLARCHADDIAASAKALRAAAHPRIHVFLATSAIHREFKLRMAKDEIVRRAVEGIQRAREHFDDVEFSAEDAARTELDFLTEVVERAIEAGARTINIPDTVGYAVPSQFAEVITHLKRHVRGIDKAVLSVHCHDDLGLAVANSLAAVAAGARQVECTINGIGERAGNCSLEEVVMAMRTRGDYFNVYTNVQTQRLYPTSRLLSKITGLQVQRNKAIVGQNAFAHESGIHQHGMLMHHSTYEIMRPEDVGFSKSNLVLGKHSGRHSFRQRVQELGYQLDEIRLNKVFEDFKALADKKKEIYDADIEALVSLEANGRLEDAYRPAWELVTFQTNAGSGTVPSAAVCLQHVDGRKVQEAGCGDGPIDAVFKTIERITDVHVRLREYTVRSVSVGEDAQGEIGLEVEFRERTYRARWVSTDIIEGSARAFLQIVNRILSEWRPLAPVASMAAGGGSVVSLASAVRN
jgi:2-isopropylmalate synthase